MSIYSSERGSIILFSIINNIIYIIHLFKTKKKIYLRFICEFPCNPRIPKLAEFLPDNSYEALISSKFCDFLKLDGPKPSLPFCDVVFDLDNLSFSVGFSKDVLFKVDSSKPFLSSSGGNICEVFNVPKFFCFLIS
jgi:hypothetical protein